MLDWVEAHQQITFLAIVPLKEQVKEPTAIIISDDVAGSRFCSQIVEP